MPQLITLTTDFGISSSYVAQMKGVILSGVPHANIIDISHAIAPQQIRAGAIVLRDVYKHFPADTIHIAVVDPGVGTDRPLIYAQMHGQHFLAPDNGLLSLVARETTVTRIFTLTNRALWQPQVSHTFHGRDVLAPVAAQLAQGIDPQLLGPSQSGMVMLDWPEPVILPGRIVGQVVEIDGFGNLITNISLASLATAIGEHSQRLEVELGGHVVVGLSRTYGDNPPETLAALVGSSGYLEVAEVNGHAARRLKVVLDDPVVVHWPAATLDD